MAAIGGWRVEARIETADRFCLPKCLQLYKRVDRGCGYCVEPVGARRQPGDEVIDGHLAARIGY